MPIRSSEGIYSLAEAMYDGTDAELNRYERTNIDAQYARPDDYIYSFAELVYDDPINDQSPKPNGDPGKQPLYDTVSIIFRIDVFITIHGFHIHVLTQVYCLFVIKR
jgi:hypothetical protein